MKRIDEGWQEQSRKKQKKRQQSPATDSWTVDFMTRQEAWNVFTSGLDTTIGEVGRGDYGATRGLDADDMGA